MTSDEERVLVSYLVNCSKLSLSDFFLRQANKTSSLERDLRATVEKLIETAALTELGALLRNHGEEIVSHSCQRELFDMPRTLQRSAIAKRPIGLIGDGHTESRVREPEIFIRVPSGSGRSAYMVKAHIRVRSGKYRTLVWREGHKVREFYLGTIKKLPYGTSAAPLKTSAAPLKTSAVAVGKEKRRA